MKRFSGRSTWTREPPPPSAKNPACAAFEEYKKVPKTVPLDFTEDDVTWVTPKIYGASGTLREEAIEIRS